MISPLETENILTEYVVFELSHDFYCVPIISLDKIIPVQPIRFVPNLPSYIKGVIDYEEQIVPIIDLKERMRLRHQNQQELFILLFNYEDRLVGVLADSIFELKESTAAPKKEFTYVSEHIHIFSDGTLRMKDNSFKKNNRESDEELVIVLSIKKICDVIKRELIDDGSN